MDKRIKYFLVTLAAFLRMDDADLMCQNGKP